MDDELYIEPLWTQRLPNKLRNRIQGRQYLQRVLGNIVWLLWENAVRLVLSFAVGIWAARYLGPADWGLLNYALAFVGLFLPLVFLGLRGVVLKECVNEPQNVRAILGSSYFVKVAGAIIAMIAVNAAIRIIQPEDDALHLIVLILSIGIIFRSFEVIDYWFQFRIESKYPVLVRNIAAVIGALIKAALILASLSVVSFAWVSTIELAVLAVGLVVMYRFRGQLLKDWRVVIERARALLRESWPMAFTLLSLTLYSQVNRIVLGQVMGVESVGIYAAAYRLTEVWFVIPVAISLSVAPVIIASKKTSEGIYLERIQTLFTIMTVFSVCIIIFILIFSDTIVLILLGADYSESAPVLSIMIWMLLFIGWGYIQGPWDVNEELLKPKLIRTVLGLAVMLLLNLIMIPTFGVIGAAISTVLAFGISSFWGNLIHPKTRTMFAMQVKSLLPWKIFRVDRGSIER